MTAAAAIRNKIPLLEKSSTDNGQETSHLLTIPKKRPSSIRAEDLKLYRELRAERESDRGRAWFQSPERQYRGSR